MEKYTRKKYSAGGLNWQKYPTKKVNGLYEIKGDGMDYKVNIVFFERYDDDQYSLYPLEKDRNLFKEILVKSTALNSLDKGISVKGETNDGKKVFIKRLSNQDFSYEVGGGVGKVEHFTLDKDKLNQDAKWYADRIKSGQMSTTKKSIEERIEEYKKDLFLLEIGRKKPSNIIGTGYKGNAKKMANTWLLEEIYKNTKILELLGDNYSNGGGVGLKGNQSRIDMNHNGKIDAEDFKLLRSSMNGAWRNEHEYVNSTSKKNGKVIDYEVKYARKNNSSRKGYKGKSNFEDGGSFDERDKQGMIYALQEHISSGEIANMTNLSTYDSIAESRSKAIEYYVKYGDKPYSMTELKNVLSIVSTPLYHKYRNKFATGGGFEKLSNSVAKRYEGDAVAPKYQRMYGKRYDKEEAKEVGDKVAGKMKAMQMQNKKAFGGFFKKESIKTKYPDLDDKQVMLKNGEYVQVVDQIDDVLMVINSNQLGTGIRPKRINISEVDNASFMSGGSIKTKLTLYKSNYLSTPNKQVLVSKDGYKIYIYENGILYDSPDAKTKGASHRMSKLELNIIPFKK